MKATKTSLLILPALAALDAAAWAQATWDGGGADALWSNPLNWVDNTVPPDFSALTFDGTINLSPVNDLSFYSATGLTFGPTAGAFVLTGEAINLSGTVLNSTALEQRINFNSVFLNGATTFDTGAGTIDVAAPLTAGGALVTKNGTGTLKFTNSGFSTIADSAGGALTVNNGSVLFDGGDFATYSILGEAWIGAATNQNVTTTVNSGTLNVTTWLAVARGNGSGAVSSDLVLNNTALISAANFSTGFNAGSAANMPRGSVTLNDNSAIQITNNANLFFISESAGSNTTILLNDSSRITHNGGTGSQSAIGVAGKALLHIASPTAAAEFNRVYLGSAGSGSGAIWNRGTFNITSGASVDHFSIGQAAGSYGYYLHDSATPSTFQELGVGGVGGGNGVLEVRSGTVGIGQWLTPNRGAAAQSSMILVAGGTFVPADINGRFEPNWSTTNDQYFALDVGAGGLIDGTANGQISLNRTARAGNFGLMTIHDGGIVEAPRLTGNVTGTTAISFNNGTLVATASDVNLIGNVFDAVLIQAGGATIDTNGFNSGIPAPLSAPAGNGIGSIPLTAGGTGYIGRPIVKIIGGGGVGATAVADFDEATGAITGIRITSPGTGYTTLPTIQLVGGGGTGATTGTPALAAAPGGGLTKNGLGTLTLSAANGYTGGTIVNAGTLSLTNTLGSATGTGAVTINSGAAIGGTGIATGAVTIASGGAVSPGVVVGNLTVGSITINSGSLLNFEITNASTLDRLTVSASGGLTLDGGGFNLYVPGTTTTFSSNGTYNLIGYTGAIGGAGVTSLSVLNSVPGKTYSFTETPGFVTLTISSLATSNFWNVDADGNWADGGNWSQAVAPNAPGDIANFGGGTVPMTAPHLVTVNAPQTVGTIIFETPQSFTIAGTSTITLDNATVPNSEITVNAGSHTISTPIAAVSATTQITVLNAADSLTLSGSISGTTNISKFGAGTLNLGAGNTYNGTLNTFAGTLQIVDETSYGASITQSNNTTIRITAPAATISKPINFDIGAGLPAGLSGAANGTANFTVEVPGGSNLTWATPFVVASGSSRKIGGGTLTITDPGATSLANVGGIAYVVQNGHVVLNGGATATYNVGIGELAIGDATPNETSLTLESGTLTVGSFLSVGRGTGTTSLQPKFIMNGGTLNTVQLFTGFNAGVAGYNARPLVDIRNGSVVNISNTLRLAESPTSFATLNMSGTSVMNITAIAQIGFGGTAVVNLSGSVFVSATIFDVGFGNNAAGNTGVGIVNQTDSSIVQAIAGGGDWRIGGAANNGGANTNDALVYGSHTLDGANTLLDTGTHNFQIGGTGRGVLAAKNGATVSSGQFPVVGRFPGSVGLLDLDNATFNQTGSGNLLIVGEQGSGVVNVRNGATLNSLGGPGGTTPGGGSGSIRLAHLDTGSGILNVVGGTVLTSGIAESGNLGLSYVYLDGGTVRASTDNFTFMQGLDHVVLGPGGAVFDTGGFFVSIAQPLKAPAGNGVTTIGVSNGGSGYLGQPIVQITGDGVGATAIAQIDGAGVLTGITITNPGIGYTTPPTVSLVGGGATVPATLGAAILGQNSGTGGIVKRGFGSLTLSGINSYTGPTVIEEGTLVLAGSIDGSSVIDVRANATFDVSSLFGLHSVLPAQTLKGNGTVTGNTTVNGTLAPGQAIGTIGTLTFNGDLALAGISDFELNKSGITLEADHAEVTGILTLGGTLRIALSGDPVALNDTFDLFDAVGFAGNFTSYQLPSLPVGLAWSTTQVPVDGTLIVVPEPGAASLLIGGLCALAGLRRRRRALA